MDGMNPNARRRWLLRGEVGPALRSGYKFLSSVHIIFIKTYLVKKKRRAMKSPILELVYLYLLKKSIAAANMLAIMVANMVDGTLFCRKI